MGLDMYAYAKDENGEEEHLAEWRKHNRLHGWMEELWHDKGRPYEGNLDDVDGTFGSQFNCVPVDVRTCPDVPSSPSLSCNPPVIFTPSVVVANFTFPL